VDARNTFINQKSLWMIRVIFTYILSLSGFCRVDFFAYGISTTLSKPHHYCLILSRLRIVVLSSVKFLSRLQSYSVAFDMSLMGRMDFFGPTYLLPCSYCNGDATFVLCCFLISNLQLVVVQRHRILVKTTNNAGSLILVRLYIGTFFIHEP